jgi:RNA binding exosome subunit
VSSREDPPCIPDPLADEVSDLVLADMELRGALLWAGHRWGEPGHLLHSARGASGKIREQESRIRDLEGELFSVRDQLRKLLEKPEAEMEVLLEELDREFTSLRALYLHLNKLCGWGKESVLHAYGHIGNVLGNLRADLATEKFLRENAERLYRNDEREDIVEWLRESVAGEKKHNLLILGGSDNSELRAQLRMAEALADALDKGEHRKEKS